MAVRSTRSGKSLYVSKVAGPDNIPGHALKTHADQLEDVIDVMSVTFLHIIVTGVFPPASRQPLMFLH